MTDIRLLDPRLLATFAAVFEARNISHAAAKLGRTQQGTSGALSRLREILGDPLFVRRGYGVDPTPKAERIYPLVVKAMDSLAQIIDPDEFDPMTAKRSIRVAAADYAIETVMRPVIGKLSKVAPLLDIKIGAYRGSDEPADFGAKAADLVITVREFRPPNHNALTLFQDGYVLAVRHGHPLAKTHVDLDQFCTASHLLVSPNQNDTRGVTDLALEKIGRVRRVSLVIPVFSIASQILADTDLVAVLPTRLAKKNEHLLACLDLPFELAPFEIMVLWPERVDYDPMNKWFRELLRLYVGDR
jgi:DNA-binding transcriptional LysR family regulator